MGLRGATASQRGPADTSPGSQVPVAASGEPCLTASVKKKAVESSKIEVASYFVRERNALATRANFGPLYVDYYLHLMQHSMRLDPEIDQILKDALGAFCLHLASRPRDEEVAWTVNFQVPLFNLFVTGHSRLQSVTGRAFTEDVKAGPHNRFISQVRDAHSYMRQSVVEFEGTDFFRIVEHYFSQSEQRSARLFRDSEETFVLVTAQPDCDEQWLRELSDESIRQLDDSETLSLLEKRCYGFACGCDLDRILPALATLTAPLIDDLYGEDDVVTIQCPRCGARFPLERTDLEAFLREAG